VTPSLRGCADRLVAHSDPRLSITIVLPFIWQQQAESNNIVLRKACRIMQQHVEAVAAIAGRKAHRMLLLLALLPQSRLHCIENAVAVAATRN